MIEFKELKINLDEKLCYIEDNVIDLTKIEFNLLVYLIEHSNKIFSRQELLNEVWKEKLSLRAVDTTISRLRKKIGIYKKYIKTRSGFGYGFMTN